MPEWVIGRVTSDYLRVRPEGRTVPAADDYWDSNWLNSTVELSVGGFRGSFLANFRTTDFAEFLEKLASLRENLADSVVFETLEDQLRLDVAGDGLGHFLVKSRAQDVAGTGNVLDFELEFDQTEIPPMLDQLRAILERFPVCGAR